MYCGTDNRVKDMTVSAVGMPRKQVRFAVTQRYSRAHDTQNDDYTGAERMEQ